MVVILSAGLMRVLEQEAMRSGRVSGLELMERAGQAIVDAIFGEGGRGASPSRSPGYLKPKETGQKVCVLCGPGNNGGDGFVIARLLKTRGVEVEVFLFGDPARLPPDARVNYERWVEVGAVEDLASERLFEMVPDVWVDAIFGIGLTREVPDAVYSALDYADTSGAPMVSVDMPSWFDSDTGRHLGRAHGRRFDLVVTFAAPKSGHFIGAAPAFIERLVVADIGIDPTTCSEAVGLVQADCVRRLDKVADGHKYHHGHALVISGDTGQTGAARLAARGALRMGAGLVTLGVPAAAAGEVAAQITAVMMTPVDHAAQLSRALEDARINALCIGPGCGVARAEALLPVVLAARRRVVLDADALSALARDRDKLMPLLHEDCVLTPHGGEFARLFPDIARSLNAGEISKIDAVRMAAKGVGSVVLLKGADTVIAGPDGRAVVHAARYARQAPWLATAGSGDVLAGFVTGALARGYAPRVCAEMAAWLHVECAQVFGPGLIAEDLPEILPQVLARAFARDQG